MMKCIMPTCGKTKKGDVKHCLCECGNMMYSVAKKEVIKPREVKDGSGD